MDQVGLVSRYSSETKDYWALCDSLKMMTGVLQRQWEGAGGTRKRMQILLSRNRVYGVLKDWHGGVGHLRV